MSFQQRSRSSFKVMVWLGLFLFNLLILHTTEGGAVGSRRKRFIPAYGDDVEIIEDNNLEKRDALPTFPPFPGFDYPEEFENEIEPKTIPPVEIPTTSEPTYYRYPGNDNEITTTTSKPFHRRVGSWFKKKWGQTSDWLRAHYENVRSG